MLVINWVDLRPTDRDFEQVAQACEGVVYIRSLVQALVRAILKAHPWENRADTVPIFDPSWSYRISDVVALPKIDPQQLRPDTWRIGKVTSITSGENPLQGLFQVVTIDVGGQQQCLAAKIPHAQPLPLAFPPKGEEDLGWLVNDITDAYLPTLSQAALAAIQEGHLNGAVHGDRILLGSASTLCGEEEQYYLSEIFAELSIQRPWTTADEILTRLRELGCLIEIPDEMACFALEQRLVEQGYCDLGGKQWTTQALFEQLNRDVVRRMKVPVNRSQVAKELGEDDSQDIKDYDEVELNQEGKEALESLGEEESSVEPAQTTWQPPTTPIALTTLTYLHILQGFFSLTRQLSKTFDPHKDPLLVHIRIIDSDPLPFLVSRTERIIKSIDPNQLYNLFRLAVVPVPAGTYLWLENQGGLIYRISPHPLPEPRLLKCKLAGIENGRLVIEEAEIPMHYEGESHLFKAELRFENTEALFQEAKECGLSIFDAMWYTFPKLAALHPQGYVHYKDLFNAVFFQHRMCSPHSVVAELYSRPCFVSVGEGYFRVEKARGIRRKGLPASSQAGETLWRPKSDMAGSKKKDGPAQVEAEFWVQIVKVRRDLETLDERRPFKIISVTHESVELITSTGEPRSIPRHEIEAAWNHLREYGRIDRTGIQKNYSQIHPVYVVAILAELPGVQIKLHPIRLFYKNPEYDEALPIASPPSNKVASDTFFIFQQRYQPEYADRPGIVYNWRQGIPGSNQITVGSRFIYYRTGDKEFFGIGQIDRIESYRGEDGSTSFNGYIADYRAWEPPLPLTEDLAQKLSIYQPGRLWIGQAGIRKISQQDFDFILRAHESRGKSILVDKVYQLKTEPVQASDPLCVRIANSINPALIIYRQDSARQNVLFCRQIAHQRIRELLVQDRLPLLGLDAFNRDVWQLGSIIDGERKIPLIGPDWLPWIRSRSLDDLQSAFVSGRVQITGNQTWGSGTHVVGAMLGLSDTELEHLVRRTLHDLLYQSGSIQEHITRVLDEPNGYGINVISGILHAMFPNEHVLYNRRSIKALEKLGIPWPQKWQNVAGYFAYRNFCQELIVHFDFESLSDVDWFMYSLALRYVNPFELLNPDSEPGKREITSTEAPQEKDSESLPPIPPLELTRSGQYVASGLLPSEPLFAQQEQAYTDAPFPQRLKKSGKRVKKGI